MATLAKPGLDDFDICAIISKWSLAAQKDSQAGQNLRSIQFVAKRALNELERLAANGNEQAAKDYHNILSANVHSFVQLSKCLIKIYEPIARKTTYWPALVSCFNDTTKDSEELVSMLNLGIDCGLNITGKQASINLPEVRVAHRLFVLMEVYRSEQTPEAIKSRRAIMITVNKELGRPANYRPPKLKPIPTKPEWQEEFRLRDESCKLARALKPLNKKNYKQWFKASWPLFLSFYKKDFENRICFSKFVTIAEKISVRSGKKLRGELRKYIRKRILAAFEQIAPKVDLENS